MRTKWIIGLFGAALVSGIISQRDVLADPLTPWTDNLGGAVRLILASNGLDHDGRILGGIEFHLTPGWHIYWRTPGEVGLPPVFQDERSENLQSFSVKWPLPRLSAEGGLEAFIYDQSVILPVVLTAKDPGKPLILDLSVMFGVCKDICAPSDGHFQITIPPADTTTTQHQKAIADFLAKVPIPASAETEKEQGIIKKANNTLYLSSNKIMDKKPILIVEYGAVYARTARLQGVIMPGKIAFDLGPQPKGTPPASRATFISDGHAVEFAIP